MTCPSRLGPTRLLRFLSAAALALALSGVASAETATLAPLRLPEQKAAGSELKYALGKDWPEAVRAEVKDAMASARVFSDVVPEGGDVTLTFELQDIKRTFDDRVSVSGRGTLTFTARGRYAWSRGGATYAEAPFDLEHVVTLDHEPWRQDLSAGWREVLHRAALEAMGGAKP